MAEAAIAHLLGRLDSIIEDKFKPFADIQEDINSARQELDHVAAFLRGVDTERENDEEVRTWVKHLRDAVYDLEDILDEYKLLTLHNHEDGYLRFAHRWVNNFKAHSRIMPNLRRLGMNVRSICERHQMLSHQCSPTGQRVSTARADSTWQDHQSDAFLVDNVHLVGIEERKNHLMQQLLGGLTGTGAVAIHGMGGLGKSTLVWQVYDDPVVKKHFGVRAWVTLSPSFCMEDLLKDMFRQLSREPRRKAPRREGVASINFLRISIRNLLLNRRFLVILDDVWHVNRWNAVKNLFPNNDLGSRVMLTTRHAKIAAAACKDLVGEPYSLMPLSTEESWELFCRKTFQGDPCPTHLKDICTHILEKCEGLPLPIVAISGVLATKDTHRLDEWNKIRQSLRSDLDGNDHLKKINEVLSFSFSDLPYYLRSCFLHLSMFPEGHVIESAKLIRIWVEEQFVEAKAGKSMEEVAEDCLNELLSRSLMQVAEMTSDGRVKKCRIHHLLRSIAISKCEEQIFAAIADEQNPTWPEKVRRLSVHGSFQPFPEHRRISHLRSLLTFGVDKSSVKAALPYLKLLRVLDLQAAPLKKFPVQIIDMHFLRYLSLRYSQVQTIPRYIGKLVSLEVLDLKHTNVTELPIEISGLRQLRHLLVYRYEFESYAHTKYGIQTFAGIGGLTSLQKLCYIEADNERSSMAMQEIGKLTQLRRLCILKLKEEDGATLCSSIMKLSNLRALSVSSRDDEVLDLQSLWSLPQLLQRIYLTGRLAAMPSWLCSMHGLVTLHLKGSQLNDDPLPSLQKLQNLIHLELLNVHDWKVLHFEGKGFPKLKALGLDVFDRLTSIEVEENAMPRLEQLIIQRCKSLQDIPSGIEHLSHLKVVEFFDVHDELVRKLKRDDVSEDWKKVAHIPELRYGFCRDGCWDVETVKRSGNDESSSSQGTYNSGEYPRVWK